MGFSPGSPGSLPPQKPTTSKFQFDLDVEHGHKIFSLWLFRATLSKQSVYLLFIYLSSFGSNTFFPHNNLSQNSMRSVPLMAVTSCKWLSRGGVFKLNIHMLFTSIHCLLNWCGQRCICCGSILSSVQILFPLFWLW